MSARRPRSKGKRQDSEKKVVKQEETEDPVITELKATNESLKSQNEALQETVNHYHNKLHAVIQHILNNNLDNYEPAADTSLINIPESDVTRLITSLNIAATSMFQLYQGRLEHLQEQLAQLNSELVKVLALKVNTERGLHNMQKLGTVDDLKVAAKRLWYNNYSTHLCVPPDLPSQETAAFTQLPKSAVVSRPASAAVGQGQALETVQEAIPAMYLSVLNPKTRSITITPGDVEEPMQPPEQKMAGETHIFHMHVGLRSLVIRELSQQKGNANDWRLMATRVGIPESLVQQWIKMRAPNAMALVMRVWGDSSGATVRMLHRHLVSPQMKAAILAKRISDFYQVD
ncbi:unnamed protein product [Candidula unifasciata]|uniref:Death domain-containing protein n=1 Tax=Candidula unifasciata TaxID=100452 RepID=A0A8S3ZU72_9EUPU|nr:unnamed protein product [Candidula unifasciata]